MTTEKKQQTKNNKCSVEGCKDKKVSEIGNTCIYSCKDPEHIKVALLNAVRKNL